MALCERDQLLLCAARICTLTNIVHKGNNMMIHGQFEMTSRSTRPHANPEKAIQRGRMAVRKAMTQVENMNTAAILRAKMFRNA